jgi:PAS domain S-box-containing protein
VDAGHISRTNPMHPPAPALVEVLAARRQAVVRALADTGVVDEATAAALVDALLGELRRAARPRRPGEELDPRLRDVVEHAPAAVYVKDRGGRYVFVNRWMADFLGHDVGAMLGRTAAALLPADIAERIRAREEQALALGELITEDPYPTPRGERTLLTVRFPFRLRAGETGLFVIGFDVTDRQRAQAEAEHARELLELGDAFIEVDRDWRILRMNANQERLSRTPRAAALGRVFWELWPDAAAPETAYARELRRCMAERVPVQFVERYASLDVWMAVSAYPTSDGGLAAFMRDASERMRTEARLREALDRLTAHVATTPLAVVEWDSDYRVTSFSRRAEELFGWTAEEILGKRIDEMPWVPREDWPSVRAVMRDMAAGTRPTNVNANRNIRKDGSIVYCEWYNSALRDSQGRLVSVLSLVLDATGRQQAEDALRAANARLREADRRKDEFLGMLSHELRNPLAPIRNSIYILNRGHPSSEQAARARAVIERQTEHLARIVDDLLDVTRIARGKIELRWERADVAAVVRRAAEDHRAVAVSRGLELTVDVPGEPLWALIDPTRVAQIVGNLVSNAIKFTPAGGTVAVSVACAGAHCEIRVRDTGVGISPEMLALVFEPFVQGEHSLARTDGGLGLGLALVKGLAELHGGGVSVTSAGAGTGTLFTVRLPLATQAEAKPAPAGQARAPRAAARRVLVVEDSRDAAETMADLLRLFGHEPSVAEDGPAAVRMARTDRPDVVLCDIGLPGMDGYEVARTLRADPALRGIRLVAVSGYAQPDDLARAREAGFDRHISKPPDPEEILRAVAS